MELSQQDGFLEELLGPKMDNLSSISSYEIGDFTPNGWHFESFDQNRDMGSSSNPALLGFCTEPEPSFQSPFCDSYCPCVDGFSVLPDMDYSSSTFQGQEEYPSMVDDYQNQCLVERRISCKLEMEQVTDKGVCKMGFSGEKKSKNKKVEGQPSKNLMAERRRRKRLNDRLSMLRSIVPKISKMDRTSILGDTIEYVKELQEKINNMHEEETKQMNSANILEDLKPRETLVRNSPKFDVERRDTDTRIGISCAAGKPGLLLSTVNTLEALGLEIQQCVISCFSDFSMQATCSEEIEQRMHIDVEDMKQRLFTKDTKEDICRIKYMPWSF